MEVREVSHLGAIVLNNYILLGLLSIREPQRPIA